jgi:hypothetical protein
MKQDLKIVLTIVENNKKDKPVVIQINVLKQLLKNSV